MNIHHLELFYHVAKCKGGSAAARQMTLDGFLLLGICFWREAPERAIRSDRRAGKWGLSSARAAGSLVGPEGSVVEEAVGRNDIAPTAAGGGNAMGRSLCEQGGELGQALLAPQIPKIGVPQGGSINLCRPLQFPPHHQTKLEILAKRSIELRSRRMNGAGQAARRTMDGWLWESIKAAA
jgi:hypothetical protein